MRSKYALVFICQLYMKTKLILAILAVSIAETNRRLALDRGTDLGGLLQTSDKKPPLANLFLVPVTFSRPRFNQISQKNGGYPEKENPDIHPHRPGSILHRAGSLEMSLDIKAQETNPEL